MQINLLTLSDIHKNASFGSYHYRNAQGRMYAHSFLALLAALPFLAFSFVCLVLFNSNFAGLSISEKWFAAFESPSLLTNGFLSYVGYAIAGAAVLFFMAYSFYLTYKYFLSLIARMHGWGLSGWWLALILPVVWIADTILIVPGVIWEGFLLFKKEKATPGKFTAYGDYTYSKWSRVFAWLPIIAFGLAVAALTLSTGV